jgi:hypothetical protein
MPHPTKAVNWQEIPVTQVSQPKQLAYNREEYRLNVLKQHAIFRSRGERGSVIRECTNYHLHFMQAWTCVKTAVSNFVSWLEFFTHVSTYLWRSSDLKQQFVNFKMFYKSDTLFNQNVRDFAHLKFFSWALCYK